MIDHEKDQISSQIVLRFSSAPFEEETCDPEENAFKNDDFEQNPNTSFEENLEDLSIRNLIHLVHEFHRTQNSINTHPLQNEEQHEH
jgi:hypothetical protein